jgi:hemoglobin
MTVLRTLVIGAAALLLAAAGPGPVAAQTETGSGDQVDVPAPPGEEAETEVVGGATLYQRLGGYDTIAEAVDDVLRRMGEDESLKRFLEPLDAAEMRRLRQNTVDFVCEKTGGPCFYTGGDLAKAHEGTGITAQDWERASEIMVATLDARGVQGELRDEIGGFIAGLRRDIVSGE